MRRSCIVMAVCLGAALNLRADFAGDFQAAKKLLNDKDYQAAGESFEELAASAPKPRAAAAALSFAAIALGHQGEVDSALELARTIQQKPMSAYTQMEVLTTARQRQELVDAFKDEDIDAWPDRINYRGFQLRGTAYGLTGDRQAAARDLERCVDLAGSDVRVKIEALNSLGGIYRQLEDDVKAADAYKRAFSAFEESPGLKGCYLFPSTLLGAVGILIDQGQYDEARKLLSQFSINPEKEKRGPWDFLVLEAYGNIHAGLGEKAEALSTWQEAVAIKTHQGFIDRVNKKIEELTGDK